MSCHFRQIGQRKNGRDNHEDCWNAARDDDTQRAFQPTRHRRHPRAFSQQAWVVAEVFATTVRNEWRVYDDDMGSPTGEMEV